MTASGDETSRLRTFDEAIAWQAEHCRYNGAPLTARIIDAMHAVARQNTVCGRIIREWPGLTYGAAMPLRLAGGLHCLHLSGAEPRLAPVYRQELTAAEAVDAVIVAAVSAHDAFLAPWFDGPPQTNEAGRSASLMAGLAWLSAQVGPRFEVNEIGASAGINTMMERYAYDLGGVRLGPDASPVLICPEWRGEGAPPAAPVEIVAIRGCDRAPVNLTDPEAALRLKSYVWAENTARLERLDAVIALAGERAPALERADAADWVERILDLPQQAGVTRVLDHSIVWQYLPPATQERIEVAMARAGAAATSERPLAWVRLETNRTTFRHELTVRYWPYGEQPVLLAEAQAHGAWVHWLG